MAIPPGVTAGLEGPDKEYIQRLVDEAKQLDMTRSAREAYVTQSKGMSASAQQIAAGIGSQIDAFKALEKASAGVQKLPGQFLSVFTALQAGQDPVITLLAQGLRMVETFGSVGAAANGAGVFVGGLVNPIGIAAAAVGALAVAYNEGSKESDAYRKAIELTGNAVGTTEGQMHAMAASIDGVVGTHGKAAESLAIFVSQSATGAETLEQFTQAAIGFERATGQAVSETAKQFASLQGDPLNSVLKLNNGMNFLTDATYSQIKSLEDQGLVTEAAGVAQAAFADALTERTGVMEANLGTIERGWRSVKDVVAEAWDSIKSVGRQVGAEGQYAAQKGIVDHLQSQVNSRKDRGLATGDLDRQLDAARGRLEILNKEVVVNQANAALDAERSVRVKARAEADKDGLKYLAQEEKLKRQIGAETEKIKRAYVGLTDDTSQKAMNAEIAARERAILATASKPKTVLPSSSAGKERSEYDNVMKHLDEVPAKAAVAEAAQASYTKSQAEYMALMGSPAWKTFSEREQEAIKAKYEVKIAAEKETKANLEAAQSREKYIASLSGGIDKIQADIVAQEEANTRMGMSKEAIAALEISKLEMMAVDLELQAIKVLDKNLDEAAYALLIQQAQGYRALAQAKKDGAAKEQTQASDAQAKESQKKATTQSEEAAKKTQEQWKATADGISKSLTDAFMKSLESGKDFGKNLANALKEQFKNLVLKPVIKAVMDPIAGGLNNLLSGLVSNLTGVASSGTGGSSGGLMNVFSGLGAAKTAYGALTANWVAPGSSYWNFATSGVGKTLGFSNSAPIIGNNPSAYIPAGGQLTGLGQAAAAVIKFLPWAALIATGMKMAGNAFDQGYRLEDRTIFKSMGLISPAMNFDTRLTQKLGFSERTANIITGASLVAKMASKLGLQATAHTGAGAIYQNGGLTEGRDIYTHGRFGMGDTREYAASAQDAVSTVAAQVGVTLDQFFASFGLKPGFKVQTAFADDISKDGAWGALRIEDSLGNKVLDWMDTKTSKWAPKEFANGEAGWKQYLDAVSDGTIDAFKKSAGQLPAWANRIIAAADTAGDDTAKVLETLLQDVAAFPNQLLEKMGTSRDALVGQFVEGLATGDASAAGQAVADTLVQSVEASLYTQAAGQIFDIINTGIVTPMIDALVTGAALTDILSQETIDSVIQRATTAAATLSAVMNDPAFAALLEQLRTSTGRALGTAGSQLTYTPRYQKSLAAAADASGTLANATDELTQSYLGAVKSLTGERDNLAVELLDAQGDQKGAKALKRQQYLDSFVDAAGNKLDAARLKEIATLYDTNEATRAMISSLERMKQISETLAQELPGVVDKFLTPAQRRQSQYSTVAADLNAVGVNVTADSLMGASKAQIGAAAAAIFNLGGISDEARLAIVRAAGALADLKDAEVDNAFAALERAVDAQRTVLNEAITELTTVFETARDAAKSLFGEVEGAVQFQGDEGRAFIRNALSVAQSTGYLPDSEKFSKAVGDATGALGQQMFATQAESDYQRLVLANELKGLQDISGNQLEKTKAQLTTLEDQLTVQRQQVEALGGIDASVLSVEQAIDRLGAAINGAQSAQTASRASTKLTGSGGASYDLSTGTGTNAAGTYFRGEEIKEAAFKAIREGATPQQIYNIVRDSGFTMAQAEQIAGSAPGSLQKLEAEMGWGAAYGGTGSYEKKSAYSVSAMVEPTAYDPMAAGNALAVNTQVIYALQDVRAELVEMRKQNDQLQYAASRTADAVNGRPEAPMLVENV